jgi:hypothetical protein
VTKWERSVVIYLCVHGALTSFCRGESAQGCHTIRLGNFAGLRRSMVLVSDEGISGKQDSASRKTRNNDESRKHGRQKESCNGQNAHYLSIKHIGSLGIVDDVGLSVLGFDIDISCDGEHWVHLVGHQCLRSLQ